MINEKTLGFADIFGNAQFISVGNLDEDDMVFLFLMASRSDHVSLDALGHSVSDRYGSSTR